MNIPAIKITSTDFDRLDDLLERPQYRQSPAAAALRRELARAEIVEPAQVPPGVVTMRSTARCVEAGEGREYELTLVYPDEADGGAGQVSVLAPVGTAMLGLAAGQEIDWPGPGGQMLRLRVLAVTYQPEAAGEHHR